MTCCCCCLYKSEDTEVDDEFEVYTVEDGDHLQNLGVGTTLELIRRLMELRDRPIADQPLPAYSEFDKYPLANEDGYGKTVPPPSFEELFQTATPSRYQIVNPSLTQTTAASPISRRSTWIEPFPKPPGQPPPVPSNWFYTRLASIRQSLAARFGPARDRQLEGIVNPTITTAQSSPERSVAFQLHEAADGTPTVVQQIAVPPATTPVNFVSNPDYISPTTSNNHANSANIFPVIQRSLTTQSSLESEGNQERVIVFTRPGAHQSSQSISDIEQTVLREFMRARRNTQ